MNSVNPGRSPILRLIVPVGVVVLAVVVLFVIATSLGGSGSDEGGKGRHGHNKASKQKPKEKTYTVEPGDTLTTISDKTGVSVDKLTRLNPKIDPQALGSGQELRLR